VFIRRKYTNRLQVVIQTDKCAKTGETRAVLGSKRAGKPFQNQKPCPVHDAGQGFCDPDWIRTNDLLLSLPTTGFPASLPVARLCGLDYIFTISGVPRVVSTEPF
jgi:hypothetical protein